MNTKKVALTSAKNGLCRVTCLNYRLTKANTATPMLTLIKRPYHNNTRCTTKLFSNVSPNAKSWRAYSTPSAGMVGNKSFLSWGIFATASLVAVGGVFYKARTLVFAEPTEIISSQYAESVALGALAEVESIKEINVGPVLPQPNEALKVNVMTSLNNSPIDTLVQKIKTANTSLKAAVYKFDNDEIYFALVDALNRGVKIQLVCDKKANSRARANANKLRTQGAMIHFWDFDTMKKLHAKFTIVDSEYVLTGSSNWTNNADGSNLELLLEFTGDVSEFVNLFDDLWGKVVLS
eukprot:TRINITY_DN2959_c0_g1_i1.p1 TRINITY_DN2959_c0_g1~~TRINITY_DN2959_c0_g1_i1.p1  ORF type:complete len:316 (+),score=67.46 TRINITY_DN2959_c0_g1_i1:71-949(+)